jgi:hypothetical protein
MPQQEFNELANLIGLSLEGGTAPTEQICAAIEKNIPKILLPFADIGVFSACAKAPMP